MGLQLKGVFGSTYLRVTIEISQKSRQTDCDQRAMAGWKQTRAGVSRNAASEALRLNAVARSWAAEPNTAKVVTEAQFDYDYSQLRVRIHRNVQEVKKVNEPPKIRKSLNNP